MKLEIVLIIPTNEVYSHKTICFRKLEPVRWIVDRVLSLLCSIFRLIEAHKQFH